MVVGTVVCVAVTVGVVVKVVGVVVMVSVFAGSVTVTVGVVVTVVAGTTTVVAGAVAIVDPEVVVAGTVVGGLQVCVVSNDAARIDVFPSLNPSSDHRKRVATVCLPASEHSPSLV